MDHTDRSNDLPMVRTLQDQERDSYHQDVSVHPHCPESNGTKTGEIQASRDFERGEEKWCKEHIQRKETDPISEEGQNLLEDTDRCRDQASLLKEYYESRKRERIHEDDSFM